MTAVEKHFFTPLYVARSPWSVVAWWESRRPLFNLAVGAAGLLSLGVASLLEPVFFPVPWQAVVTYGVAANAATPPVRSLTSRCGACWAIARRPSPRPCSATGSRSPSA